MLAAERDWNVFELWDQPLRGRSMPLRYLSRSGRPVVTNDLPDFFELRQESACLMGSTSKQSRAVTTLAATPLSHRASHRMKTATVAVGHTILVPIYHLLKHNVDYQDLRPHYFAQRDR